MRSRYSFQERRHEFANRREAGQALARRLAHLAGQHPVVLALPRGGVPVGYEIALALARLGAARTVLAVPVAPARILDRLPIGQADFVCLLQPEPLVAVGHHYADFTQTTDEEVVDLLARALQAPSPA